MRKIWVDKDKCVGCRTCANAPVVPSAVPRTNIDVTNRVAKLDRAGGPLLSGRLECITFIMIAIWRKMVKI